MDERLSQRLDQAADYHPEYDLDPDDMLIITRVTLQAFQDYLGVVNPGSKEIEACLSAVILAIPIDD